MAADTLQTLALLNGKEIALTQAKNLVDQVGLSLAALQSANAAEKAPWVTAIAVMVRFLPDARARHGSRST